MSNDAQIAALAAQQRTLVLDGMSAWLVRGGEIILNSLPNRNVLAVFGGAPIAAMAELHGAPIVADGPSLIEALANALQAVAFSKGAAS